MSSTASVAANGQSSASNSLAELNQSKADVGDAVAVDTTHRTPDTSGRTAASQFPQTGDQSSRETTLMGLVGLAIAGMLSLVGLGRRRDQ
jgi:LPXTG-motif cell wall-anchored protein